MYLGECIVNLHGFFKNKSVEFEKLPTLVKLHESGDSIHML